MILRISVLAFFTGVASLSLRELNLRPGAADRLATRAKLAECKEEESLVNVAAVMGFNYAYEGFII